jgi:hypothetical protein
MPLPISFAFLLLFFLPTHAFADDKTDEDHETTEEAPLEDADSVEHHEDSLDDSHGDEDDVSHEEKHEIHQRFFVGIKGTALASVGHDAFGMFGTGIFFDVAVFHDWLKIEVVTRFLRSSHGTVVPVELMFKKPFHPSDRVILFYGLGPGVAFHFAHEEKHIYPTIASVFGTYIWITDHVGINFESISSLVFEDSLVSENGFGIGVVFGW